MKTRHLFLFSILTILLIVLVNTPTKSQLRLLNGPYGLMAGRNVNMVGGTDPVTEEPYDIGLQRQNEPSIAVSARNPMHLIAGANDWRPVEIDVVGEELPGVQQGLPATDAWMGIYKSINGAESWYCEFLPGSPVEDNIHNSPIYGYDAVADPVFASGAGGLVVGGGITFNRGQRGEGALFAFRYLDRNNQEAGDPWVYVDTQILDLGDMGHFIDKEWVIVDRPRTTELVQLPTGDWVPKFNVFIVYTSFMGNTDAGAHGKLMITMSHDSGNTWSKPTQITDAGKPYQAATMTIDQRNGRLHIAYRRFAKDGHTDAIMLLSEKAPNKYDEEVGYSHDNLKFGKPIVVAEIDPFDQATTPTTFRTNTYPSITSDHRGLLYIVNAERNEQNYSEILLRIHNPDTGEWGGPFILGGEDDYPYAGDPGHKFQPMICYNQGYITAAWLDSRFDDSVITHGNTNGYGYYVEKDFMPYRRTIDVRAIQFEPFDIGDNPVFPKSIQVSKYPWLLIFNSQGVPTDAIQMLDFPPTLELFAQNSRAFVGDYIGLAGAPPFVPDGNGGWKYNTERVENPVFHVAWADNRDVLNQDNLLYFNPPGAGCDPNATGTRNQNVYTSRLTRGIIAGSPGNTKPLNIKRAFVVLVKNTTGVERPLHLTIDAPAGVTAKFRETGQIETDTLDIILFPYSSYAATVVVYPNSDEYASVTVNVWEAGVLLSQVVLNPDSTTPWIEEPDVDYTTPHVAADNEIHTPHVAAYQIVHWSTEEANPHVAAPHVAAPHVAARSLNNDVVTPHVAAPHVAAPHVAARHVGTVDYMNPHVAATHVDNLYADSDITDVYAGIENRGNTTSAYAVSSLPSDLPEGVLAQLIVYRVHTTPSAQGCELVQEEHHELLVNSLNPHVAAPHVAAVTPELSFRTGTAEPADFVDAKFALKPQERAIVLYRFIDKHTEDDEVFYPEVIELEFSPDTPDIIDKIEQPYVSLPLRIVTTALLPNGTVGQSYPSLYLEASGGTSPYEWGLTQDSNPLPDGLALTSDGELSGTPQTADDYVFTVQVTDNFGGPPNERATSSKDFNINVLPDNSIEISGWARGVGGTGLEGVAIEFSGRAGVALTDETGYYSQRVPYDWTGTSKAYLRGYYAEPTQRIYANLITDVANQDFTLYLLSAHVTISGMVTEDIGGTPTPVEGVVIDFSDGLSETTDVNGYYAHFVTSGWTGDATPSFDGYSFTPPSGTYDNIVTNHVTDYTAIPVEAEIAYIYSYDTTTANSYKDFLDSRDYPTTLIDMNDIVAGMFDDYALILIGSDTGGGSTWGDTDKVDAIQNSGKQILGLDEGGYAFFGKLSLAIGYGYGWHGSDTDIIVVDSSHNVFNTPNNLGVTTGQTISVYTSTSHVGINLPDPPANVVLLGREVISSDHYPLVQEASRYLLWGWTGSPDAMTEIGKDLFENVVASLTSVTTKLIAYYPFNGNANDESGNGLNGAVEEAVLTTDRFGNANKAYGFDGEDDAIKVADNDLLDITEQISLSAWIYPTETKTQYIIRRSSRWNPPVPYELGLSETGDIVFTLSPGGVFTQVRETGYALNEWSFIVGTYDGTTMKLYVNGTEVNSLSVSGSLNEDDAPLLIGTRLQIPADTFKGKLDDISIYNVALDDTEIEELYGLYSGTIAYYPFNGNANDESGNGYHGTVYGAALTTDRFGSQDSAHHFDGVDDYIDVGDMSDFNFGSGDFTLEAWIEMDPDSSGPRHILGKREEPPPYPGNWTRLYSLEGYIHFEFRNTRIVSPVAYNDGQWHHIMGKRENGDIFLYVDSQLIDSVSASEDVSNTGPFKIGKWSFEDSFHGKIDDIRVYRYALSVVECVPPPPGLVSWWPGDGNADDFWDGNHGTLENGATFATGIVGQAFSFDGVDDYVNVGDVTEIGGSGAITTMAWFKADTGFGWPWEPNGCPVIAVGDISTGGHFCIRAFSDPAWSFSQCYGSPSRITLGADDGGSDMWHAGASAPATQTGVWYHVAATYNPTSNIVELYVNGELAKSSTLSQALNLNPKVQIGTDDYWNQSFHGEIDEVAIFDRTLTANEIQAIYHAGSAGKCK